MRILSAVSQKRPAGRPHTSCLATMKNDLSYHNLSMEDAAELALDRRNVVVSGVGLINEVNRHWARLVLGWVAACGRVNHLGM